VQAALDTYRNRKFQRLLEEREREALLNLQFQPNSSQETSILMDHGQKHHTSLQVQLLTLWTSSMVLVFRIEYYIIYMYMQRGQFS
jgi:hypothetical protein